MLQVKHFAGGLAPKALRYLDEEINEWVRENGIKVKMFSECFGQSPTGMSGSKDDAVLLCVWYESEEQA